MYCKYCGAELPDGSKFCQFCGMKLDGPEYEQNTEPVQAAPEEVAVASAAAVEPAVQDIPEPEPVPVPEPIPAQAQQQEVYRQPAPEQNVYEQQQVYAPPVQEQPKKKSKKGLVIGLIIGGVALLILIILFLLLLLPKILGGKKVEIDFRNYAMLKCEGMDTRGYADADFDWDALIADYGDQLKLTKEYSRIAPNADPKEEIRDMAYYYIDYDRDGELSNGDSVNYHLCVYSDIGELMNVKIVDAEEYDSDGEIILPMTVSGLEEAEMFDPFENIEITVTGFSPFGELEYNLDNAPQPSKDNYYAFDVSQTYDLANGDVVTITLDDWYATDYFLTEYGMLPSKTTYEYTVEGLPELLTDASQISAADMDSLKTLCEGIFYDEHISYDDEAITTNSYSMIGTILKVSKDPSAYSSSNNALYCVIEQNCTVSQNGENAADFTAYSILEFDNLFINADGTLEYDADDYYEPYHSYSIDTGNWTISGNYGYASVDEVKEFIINAYDSFNTYQDNLK